MTGANGFEHRLRVFWEDTDAGGIVYHANYLKFAERARTEALLALGLSQTALRETHGILFAVREARVTYLAPARLEDQLVVTTRAAPAGAARIEMAQDIWREATCLARCRLTLVCLGPGGKAVRVPAGIRDALARLPAIGADP
jgi:acyl-CoA thioester hydrolase